MKIPTSRRHEAGDAERTWIAGRLSSAAVAFEIAVRSIASLAARDARSMRYE
jgi:hypothetical protein